MSLFILEVHLLECHVQLSVRLNTLKKLGFPIEHPIDSIKTQWQARPYLKNEFAII